MFQFSATAVFFLPLFSEKMVRFFSSLSNSWRSFHEKKKPNLSLTFSNLGKKTNIKIFILECEYFRKLWTCEIWRLSPKVDFQLFVIGLLLLAAGKSHEMYFQSPFLISIKKKYSGCLIPSNTFLQTSQKADINFIQKYSKPVLAEESCSSSQKFQVFFYN